MHGPHITTKIIVPSRLTICISLVRELRYLTDQYKPGYCESGLVRCLKVFKWYLITMSQLGAFIVEAVAGRRGPSEDFFFCEPAGGLPGS